MRWYSHGIFAAATISYFKVEYVPIAVLGSIFPDIFENIIKVRHRSLHILERYAAFFLLSLVSPYLGAFGWGALSHILLDMLTPSGVKLFGKKIYYIGIKTGSINEKYFTAAIVIIFIFTYQAFNLRELPFFIDYYSFYERGLIDMNEFRRNRFVFF